MTGTQSDTISINSEQISPSNPYVIAEIGTNHNRNIEIAKELINVAEAAGADAVKYQVYHSRDIVTERIGAEEYGFEKYYDVETALEAYEEHLRTPREWFPTLFEYARERGLDNVATAHCPDCASFVVDCGVDALKVASMDLTHIPLLSELSTSDLPLILSTGMGSFAEIDQAVSALQDGSLQWLAPLHCVSYYPADPAHLNLRNIPMLETAFDLPIGFSDHSKSPWTAGLAVAHGASIIEKHITLDSTYPGPDHTFALEPDGLTQLVEAVEMASESRGTAVRRPTDTTNRERYRRSIVANRKISAGTEISSEHLRFARPGTGIQPIDVDIVLGMTISRSLQAGTPLDWDDFR
jgi:sialic acid synthase SpsE